MFVVRDRVLFPEGLLRLSVGKAKSVRLVESLLSTREDHLRRHANSNGAAGPTILLAVFTQRCSTSRIQACTHLCMRTLPLARRSRAFMVSALSISFSKECAKVRVWGCAGGGCLCVVCVLCVLCSWLFYLMLINRAARKQSSYNNCNSINIIIFFRGGRGAQGTYFVFVVFVFCHSSTGLLELFVMFFFPRFFLCVLFDFLPYRMVFGAHCETVSHDIACDGQRCGGLLVVAIVVF